MMRWAIIFWIFIMSATAYLDRVNISIAGQTIADEFHLDYIHLGWIFSSFVFAYALFQAPAGRLADRFGPRLVLTAGVIWWGIFTAVVTILPTGFSGALALLMAARFCLGAGEAVVYPASNCIVSSWIPTSERGIANGLIFAGVGFGAGVTPPLITSIMVEHGWRASFWFSAAVGLAVGIVWYIVARDTPAKHPWISASETQLISAGLPPSASSAATARLPWRTIFRIRDLWFVTFSYFAYGYAAYIFFSWFFIYLSKVRGLNLKQSAYYTMLPFLAMAVGSLLGGRISDYLTKRFSKRVGRCGIAVVGMALSAIFIAMGTQVESAQLASMMLAGGAGALYLSQSSFWSVSADIGGKSAGSVSGLMNMGSQLGGTLTASLTPAIAAHLGWNASFLVAAVLCAFGAVAWWFVDPESKASAAEAPGGLKSAVRT
jgi:MFS transporter, ACS family, glucarate transporter